MELRPDGSRPLLTTEHTGSMAALGNIGQDSEAKFVPYTAGGELTVEQSEEAAEDARSEAPPEVRRQTGEEHKAAAMSEEQKEGQYPAADAKSEQIKVEDNQELTKSS